MGNREKDIQNKYHNAFTVMDDLNVHVVNINLSGNRLYIKAIAPSEDAKNKVWDAIKAIDPKYDDLICDIVVDSGKQEQDDQGDARRKPIITPPPPSTPGGGKTLPTTYTVQAGDTLSKIAQAFYGDASKYMKIFDANSQLTDPNKIQTGQKLVIPE